MKLMNKGKHSSLPWTKTGWASGHWSLDTHHTAFGFSSTDNYCFSVSISNS